jgi:hypothetical protein
VTWDEKTPAEGELRWEVKRLKERLSEGADTFATVRDSIVTLDKRLTDETRPRVWKVVTVVAGILVVVGGAAIGVVWAAAKYPDGEEFHEARRKTEDKLYELEKRSIESAGEQRLIKRDVAEIAESQKAIQLKLDQALAPARRGR